MRQEHFIERQGKKMVLFAGLLDEAHKQGLYEIDTQLLQIPAEENNNVAIVMAKVTMRKDSEPHPDDVGTPYQIGPEFHTFTGIGDASPENVGKNIKPHLLRMAETRAKARALRDAVNISAQILEDS